MRNGFRVAVVSSLLVAAGAMAQPGQRLAYGDIRRHFEPNVGQTAPEVRYLSRMGQYNLFLMESGGAVLGLPGEKGSDVVRVNLLDAAARPDSVAKDALPGHSNYFVGSDPAQWRRNVPHYEAVEYRGVYPGIDLVYYSTGKAVEFDFVVEPGSDPRQIRMAFDGARKVALDREGNLVLTTRQGRLVQRTPVVYQVVAGERVPVAARYVVRGHEVGIDVPSFDRSLALVLDPVIEWSTFLGGNAGNTEGVYGIAVDASGQAYVTGITQSTNFPTPGILQGSSDAFVAKLSSDGRTILYATYFGGFSDEAGFAITIDNVTEPGPNAYVTGQTNSTVGFPVTPGAVQITKGAGTTTTDAFVAVFDDTGTRTYATYLGGGAADAGNAIALDGSDIVVAGVTSSTDFPLSNSVQGNQGGADGFVSKITPGTSGLADLLFSTYIGGTGADQARGVAVGSTGLVYVAGEAAAANFASWTGSVPPVDDSFNGGGPDGYLAVFDLTVPTITYRTFLGGSGGTDRFRAIALDASGNAYLVGESTSAATFPVTGSPAGVACATGTDAILARIDTTVGGLAGLLYSTCIGGSGNDFARAVQVTGTSAGVVGDTASLNFPVTPATAFQLTRLGTTDAFLSVIDTATGLTTYASYLGGSNLELGNGVASDGTGIYIGGRTGSTNFPTNVQGRGNVAQGTKGTGTDGFVTRVRDTVPLMSMNDPDPGANWAVGSTRDIKWNHNMGKYTFVRIEKSEDGGSTWSTIAGSVSNQTNAINGQFNSGRYTWTVTGTNPRPISAIIRVTWTANSNVFTTSTGFTIDDPSFTWHNPNSFTKMVEGTSRTLSVSSNIAQQDNFSLGVRIGGAGPCRHIASLNFGTGHTSTWTVGTITTAPPLAITASGTSAEMCARFPATSADWSPGVGGQFTDFSPAVLLCPSVGGTGACAP